ncbi:MAG: hypothetical protein R3C05_21860 [Pirellulaceae bacterium]
MSLSTPSASPAISPGDLLHELDQRQNDVLHQLDELQAKLDSVLAELGITSLERSDLPAMELAE